MIIIVLVAIALLLVTFIIMSFRTARMSYRDMWDIFIIIGVPLISFLMAPWDPFADEEEGIPLGFLFVAIPYWVALFYGHKYKSELTYKVKEQAKLRERIYQLGVLTDENHFTQEERNELKMALRNSLQRDILLKECPELAEEIKFREDKPLRKSLRRHTKRHP